MQTCAVFLAFAQAAQKMCQAMSLLSLREVPNLCAPVNHREDLENYDAFDEGVFCRSRFWLFISYVISFASVIGACWVLLQGYALSSDEGSEVWPGVAGLFQVKFRFCFHLQIDCRTGTIFTGGEGRHSASSAEALRRAYVHCLSVRRSYTTHAFT